MRARYDRILTSTALALLLAVPIGMVLKDPVRLAAAPTPAEPAKNLSMNISMQLVPETAIPVHQPTTLAAVIPDPTIASAPAPATDPLAFLDPADRAIAEKIRDLLAAQADKFFANKKERAAAIAFYENRKLAPLWIEKGAANARATAAIARMKVADSDGLEPSDYKVPNFNAPGPDALAEAELKLTRTALTFARHLQAGRFPYSRVSQNIELPQASPEPADILEHIANSENATGVFDSFAPSHEAYRKLKAALAELRGRSGSLKGDVSRQIEIIVANMERWRWYPRDLGDAHVIVNHPDFTLKVVRHGTQIWTTRIVIGKPGMPTPLLSETMKYITVNPTWHVPPSIVHNEYLPALAQDPTVLERMGLHVSYSGGQIQITQPPGEGNALGRIRFNFPNRFLVYQHDTPDKHLFGDEVRAYSHGCMRVQDPAKYAEVLLAIARPREHWTAERIKSMFGRLEQDIQLPAPIPVHLTYQTAFVDNAGKVQMRRDIYNLDGRTLAAIKNARGIGEPAPERRRDEVASGPGTTKPARPARARSESISYDARGYARPMALQPIYR